MEKTTTFNYKSFVLGIFPKKLLFIKSSFFKLCSIILILFSFQSINAQDITVQYCLGSTTYDLVATTDSNGVIRNSYESPIGTISWNNNRWEINNIVTFYYNTEPSYPNPPDLSLGNWVGENFFNCGVSSITGDIIAALTVTADTGQNKTYGTGDPALTYTITGFVNGDDETDLDTPVAISRVVGENVGNYTITPSGGSDSNYAVSFETDTFAITQAGLTVTTDAGQTKTYGAADPALAYAITGFVNGDVEGDLDTPVAISRVAGENVGNYTITPSGASDSNYTVSFETDTFAITQAGLTITADAGQTKTYGAADPALAYTITGFVNGDVEGDLDTPVAISRVAGENVGTYTITPSAAADANYTVSFETDTFAITQAGLTVTTDAGQTKTYGAADPALTYAITGFVNGDVEGDLDTPVAISRVAGENVGNYTITPSGASDSNYTVSFETDTFAITQVGLTVTADAGQSKTYGAIDPALTYTITGFVNGDVEGDLDTPVAISRVAGENVGNYTITPSAAADSNYTISFVTNTFEIIASTLGLDDDLLGNSISVYPIPFNRELNIKADHLEVENVFLYDVLGRSINNIKLINGIIDTSNVITGMYLLRIETDKGVVVKRVVKK